MREKFKTFVHKTATTIGCAALATSLMASASSAAELVMSSWLPPQHPVVAGIMKPWADSIAKATDNRVTVRILAKPLGPPPAHFDLAADGIADITYGLHSFTRDDRFLRSQIGQFSFLGDKAEDTSVAYWDVYTGDLDAKSEHAGTKILGLFVHGPGMFHNNQRKIEKPEDFAGLKIRTPGGYIAGLAEDLGITTQFMGPGQVFEKLSTGVIDGVTFPIEALKAFKLTDHLTYSMKVPGGIYNTSWFLVMNEGAWDGISADDQAAIEALSGRALAAAAGKVWDAADVAGLELVETTDVKIHEASDAVVAKLKEFATKREAEWSKAVMAKDFDGVAALTKMRAATGM